MGQEESGTRLVWLTKPILLSERESIEEIMESHVPVRGR